MTPEENAQLVDMWVELQCVDAWHALGSAPTTWEAVAGSEIDVDDTLITPLGLGLAASASISAAISQLGALRDSLFHVETPTEAGKTNLKSSVHIYGHYGMIRCALENASMAYWLLESTDQPERIHRLVCADLEEVRQADAVRALLGERPKKPMAQREAEMRALLTKAGAGGRTLKSKSYSKIVEEVGANLEPANPSRALVLWKLCSSLAHGETRGMIAYLDRVPQGQGKPGVTLNKMSANIGLLHIGTMVAVTTTRAALEMFAQRAGMSLPV